MTDKLPRRDGTWHFAVLHSGEWWNGTVSIHRDDGIVVEVFTTDADGDEVQDRLDELDAVADYWMGRGTFTGDEITLLCEWARQGMLAATRGAGIPLATPQLQEIHDRHIARGSSLEEKLRLLNGEWTATRAKGESEATRDEQGERKPPHKSEGES